MKIANYTASFECLFTTDNEDVARKVTERVTSYLGDETERALNLKSVKSAYNVRSSYVHGQPLKNKEKEKDFLTGLSKRIDDLARRVISKVIKQDSEIFLKPRRGLRTYFENELSCEG